MDRCSRVRPTTTNSLVRAFFEEWAEVGYAGLRMERVAKRAGAGKSALYRRWSSKLDMARECLPEAALTITDITAGSNLEQELHALLLRLRRVLRHRLMRRISSDLIGEISRGSELGLAIRPFQAARRQRFKMVIDRAIARGELNPGVDWETACDLVIGTVFWRVIVNRDSDDASSIRRVASSMSAAIKALQP